MHKTKNRMVEKASGLRGRENCAVIMYLNVLVIWSDMLYMLVIGPDMQLVDHAFSLLSDCAVT